MSKAEKASEPTMDEILASIRKIIAEEPPGTRAVGDGGVRDNGDKRVHPAPRATLDDILGMADSKPAPERPAEPRADAFSWPPPGGIRAAAPGGVRATSEREPPMFPAPSGARPQTATGNDGKSGAEVAREASQKSVDLGTIVPRKPIDQTAEVAPDRKPQAGRLPDWLSRPTPLQPPVANELPPPTLPGELQRGTTSTPPAGANAAASGESRAVIAPPPPAGEASAAKDTATRPQAPAPKSDADMAAKPLPKAPSGPLNVAPPATGKPTGGDKDRAAIAEPQAATANAQPGVTTTAIPPSAARRSDGDEKSAVPVQPVKAAPASPQEKAAAASIVGGAAAVQTKDGAAAGDLPTSKTAPPAGASPAEAPGASSKAVGTAAAGEAAKPAAPVSGGAVEQGAAKAVAATPTAEPTKVAIPAAGNGKGDKPAPVPVAEPATAVAKPAVMAEKAKVAKVSPADLVPGAAVGGVRTLDDTIIELLRPMIRQWLDDNMPRMVEKALRIELAASLQAKGEAAKGDASKH